MKNIPDGAVDLILCDLPYSITDCIWDNSFDYNNFWQESWRLLRDNGSAVMFASSKFSYRLIHSNFDNYRYKWIWVKNMPSFFVHAKNAPMHKFEEILVFSKGVVAHKTHGGAHRMTYNPQGLKYFSEPVPSHGKDNDSGTQLRNKPKITQYGFKNEVIYTGGKLVKRHKRESNTCFSPRKSHKPVVLQEAENYPTDVLYFNVPFNVGRFHPTQKPVDLLEYLIKTYTNEGELVLDATMGSGSTCVAAVNTNRRYIGIELDDHFYEIACKRVEENISLHESLLFK